MCVIAGGCPVCLLWMDLPLCLTPLLSNRTKLPKDSLTRHKISFVYFSPFPSGIFITLWLRVMFLQTLTHNVLKVDFDSLKRFATVFVCFSCKY